MLTRFISWGKPPWGALLPRLLVVGSVYLGGLNRKVTLNPLSLTYQWEMSCWAVLFAALLLGNNTSLEDKQNGGRRADHLAPVATGETAAVYSAQSLRHSGETVGSMNYSQVCPVSTNPVLWHDEVRASASWPLHFQKICTVKQRISDSYLRSSGVNSLNQPTEQRRWAGRSIIFCPAFAKINTHNHWLQLVESRSSIMWNLKARLTDCGDSEPCIHAGTVTKRGVASVRGQGWLTLPICWSIKTEHKWLFKMSFNRADGHVGVCLCGLINYSWRSLFDVFF